MHTVSKWVSPVPTHRPLNQIFASVTQACSRPDYSLLNKCISVNQEACFNYLIEELLIHPLILDVQMVSRRNHICRAVKNPKLEIQLYVSVRSYLENSCKMSLYRQLWPNYNAYLSYLEFTGWLLLLWYFLSLSVHVFSLGMGPELAGNFLRKLFFGGVKKIAIRWNKNILQERVGFDKVRDLKHFLGKKGFEMVKPFCVSIF